MSPPRDRSEKWLARAAEARIMADSFTNPETKATLLRIAASYERLARELKDGGEAKGKDE